MSYPTTFEELRARHAEVAVELSGAGQSAWNGVLLETDDGSLGVANWDGSLELDQEAVTQPLRDMYATPGVQHDAETLAGYRDAFATLLHEQSHFLGPEGSSQEDAEIAFQEMGTQALEEGITEAWTQDNLNEYMTRLGADRVAPGIENATNEAAYPAFVPAARELASGIGDQAGMTQAEVLTELNNQTAAGQWSTATDLLYNSSNLPQLVPPNQEETVKLGIEQQMRQQFDKLNDLDVAAPSNLEVRSAAIGQDAVAAAQAEIARQEHVFAPPAAATQRTASLSTQTRSPFAAFGAAESAAAVGNTEPTKAVGDAKSTATPDPPSHNGSRRAVGAGPGQNGSALAGASTETSESSRDTDRAMRLAMGGQQPMTKPIKLAEDSFGSRRGAGEGAGRAHIQGKPPTGPGGRGE